MSYLEKLLWGSLMLSAAIVLAGCGGSASSRPSATTPADPGTAAPAAKPAAEPAAEQTNKADSEVEKNLAELSPEDHALAKKQKVCPVTGEALGAMGKPYKITVKGRTVFLCCSGCEDEVQKNPDKYLAKIDAQK